MIKIRPASPDDAPAMARVVVDTWFATHQEHVAQETYQRRRHEWGYAESEQGWRREIQEAGSAPAQILVATDAGQVIAVGASKVTGVDCAEVGVLYVDVPYQRLGIGRTLVESTIDHCRRLGFSTLHIAVLATNGPARRFYERLGGRKSGTRDDPDGLEIVYAWDLADSRATQ